MKLAALILALASTSALATDGTINFYGQIKGGTCPIEIIDPISGSVSNLVQLGSVLATQFSGPGSEAGSRAFGMRITPGTNCTIAPGSTASMTFTSLQGGAGSGGTLYGLKPGGAEGVAISIKDRSGNVVPNGVASADFPLSDTDPTNINFLAAYQATTGSVTPGPAEADITFSVAIN